MPALRLFLAVLLASLVAVSAAAQTRVTNTATLLFRAPDGKAGEVRSETLVLTIEAERRPSRIVWHAAPVGRDPPPTCSADATLALPPVTDADLAALPATESIDGAAGATVVLVAPGSDRDPARREAVTVRLAAGDAVATATLTETAPASGIFAGVVTSGCGWRLPRGETLTAAFAGDEGSLPATAARPIDPAGFVFDAATGRPVDGAAVSLVAEDGSPAPVWGEDGTSGYPASVASGAGVVDAGGHRYPAVAGRYRFPLLAPGRYRLLVVPPPGYAGTTLNPAVGQDADGRPWRLGAASVGEAVTLSERRPFAADIALVAAGDAPLALTRTASQRVATTGDIVQLRLRVLNRGSVASGPLALVDRLPPGLRPRPAKGATIAADGRSVAFALPSLPAGGSVEVGYLVAVAPAAPPGEAIARAGVGRAGRVEAEAAVAIRLAHRPLADATTLVGRVAEGGCATQPGQRRGVAGVRLLLDDGRFALTDADGLYHLEGMRAGRHVVALDRAGLPPGLSPVDCAASVRSAGSATSRFVEGAGGALLRADFDLVRTGTATAAPRDALPVAPADATAAGARDWLAGRRPGVEWLFPAAGHNPRAPVTRVAIAHLPGQRVALTVGGRPVDPLSFEATDTDGHGAAVSRWTGIPLAPGANRLQARVLGADGGVAATLERSVRVSGPPHAATLDPVRSRLLADGLTRPYLAVRVVDAAGRPVRAGTLVAVAVAAPHALWTDPALAGRGAAIAPASVPVTGDEGYAFVPLRPTGEAGTVRMTVTLDGGERTIGVPVEAALAPAARDWTLVGFGAGTAGFRMLSRHLDRRRYAAADGQLSFYAKGRVRGAWLLTMAYDSAQRADPDRPLLGAIDPDRYYTVYGDGSVQGHDAPTRGALYLRLERRAAQLLVGDLDTGFVDTRLARYSRALTGVSARAAGRRWRAEGFAADTDAGAVRDEIAGSGLAGPYRLRARPIVGSERLRIEVRDRVRPELVVATTPLVRTIDYDVDAATGAVQLRRPLLDRDPAGDPQWLVAEYEVERGETRRVAGGRVALSAGRLAVGATALRDAMLGDGALVGGDARLRLGTATELRGEVAAGGWHGLASGTAWLAEVERHGRSLDVLGYWREQPLGFGLGQQSLVEAGARRAGVDLRWALGDALTLTAASWHQRGLAGGGERLAGDAARLAARHADAVRRGAAGGGPAGGRRPPRLAAADAGRQRGAGGRRDRRRGADAAGARRRGGVARLPRPPPAHRRLAGRARGAAGRRLRDRPRRGRHGPHRAGRARSVAVGRRQPRRHAQ